LLPEDLAQRGDLNLQVVLLDDELGPDALEERSLVTSRPACSTSAMSTSNARGPSTIGSPSFSNRRSPGCNSKSPNRYPALCVDSIIARGYYRSPLR
jgi:hypothetical protein